MLDLGLRAAANVESRQGVYAMQETDKTDQLSSTSVGLVKRYVLAALGVLFVGIGAAGVFLPGIPTVGPLLLASFLFTKSFPPLEQRLIRNKFFAKFLPYLDGSHEMPLRAKFVTIGIMWASISLSMVLFWTSNLAPLWLIATLIIAGLIGTFFILRFGKNRGDI